LQRFVKNISEELQEHSIELVHNSSVKGYLKSSLIDVLWVVCSRNNTGNTGTNGKVSKNISILGWGFGVWSWGLR